MGNKGIAVVTGGTNGLGKAIIKELAESGGFHTIVNIDKASSGITSRINGICIHEIYADLSHQCEIDAATTLVCKEYHEIDLLVNNAGINDNAWLKDMSTDTLHEIMFVNAYAPILLVKGLMSALGGGAVCNIVSNAAHMPMRCSVAYNMSKAALHMATKQMARELGDAPTDISVWGVAPNRLYGTEMSKGIDERVCKTRGWTEEQAREYQMSSLPAGVETDPAAIARIIAHYASHPKDMRTLRGCILDLGGPTR